MEMDEATLDLVLAGLEGPKLQSAPEQLGNCTGEERTKIKEKGMVRNECLL